LRMAPMNAPRDIELWGTTIPLGPATGLPR
jgi:hypothetical protein